MNYFIDALTNPAVPFLRFALLAGIFSSAAFGMIGTLVVVKRISYIAGAVSHATLAGLGFALYMNQVHGAAIQPLLGALGASLLSALIIALVTMRKREREDTIIGTIWAVGMALGLLFIARTPG
ncbi:MAG: metal ABC transporter permease, partial [Spirochaetales bacterium]|nr:metal ABC transporter permease [Spirochaetales bacterium]